MNWERLISIFKKYKPIILAIAGLILLVALGTFLWQSVGNWRFNRDVDNKKQAVNAALSQANDLQTNANADKSLANQVQANVNAATIDYLDSVNATDVQRAETNRALRNWQAARNANRNVNAEELEEILKRLEGQ